MTSPITTVPDFLTITVTTITMTLQLIVLNTMYDHDYDNRQCLRYHTQFFLYATGLRVQPSELLISGVI